MVVDVAHLLDVHLALGEAPLPGRPFERVAVTAGDDLVVQILSRAQYRSTVKSGTVQTTLRRK